MDSGNFSPDSNLFGYFPDSAMELEFMDELLLDGCWLEATSEPFDGLPLNSDCTAANPNINPISHQQPFVFPKIEELTESHAQNGKGLGQDQNSNIDQTRSFRVEGDESNKRLWIGPRSNLGPSSSVAVRLFRALNHLGEFMREGGALIQLWVPVKQGSRQVLTTDEQPYLHPECKSLESYRNVSKSYQFSADEGSKDFLGLPGRVFLGKSPEWTPDVRFFRSDEYPRVNHAQQCDVHGSVALPVFERESGSCLGVVEIVTMRQKINYRFDLELVRKALEAVDLRSSENFTPPCAKGCYAHHNASPKITEVLESICKSHNLPLALTWAPCWKEDSKASEKFVHCFLIVDSAYYVSDQSLWGFVDACTEHQILHEQGIVGKAFTTGNQYFAVDISAFSKSKFPLSHHARIFNLHAAVAIPLHNINTGSVEFVLEFFLPRDCQDAKVQRQMLSSLSVVAQQSCQNLNFSIGTELEEITLDLDNSSPLKAASPEQSSSWVAQIMEAQKKGKAVSVPWEYQEEEVNKEFKMTQWVDDVKDDLYSKQGFAEFGVQFGQNSELKASDENGGVSSSSGVRRRKVGEKRRTKAEKTISLEVLRQYFAGSLKDAAKNIGVCPTTLKRICRQHGITRWPSRKIKKVGHSLRKLQLVIDSVQGTEGSIQIGSFYTSFPELSSPNLSNNSPFSSTNKTTDHPQPSNAHPENGTIAKSLSSSCSQSSGSSIGNTASNENVQTVQDPCAVLKRACSDAELNQLNQEEEPKVLSRSQSQRTLLGEKNANLESLPPLPKSRNSNNNNNYYYNSRDGGHYSHFRVKANFGGDKVRFSLQPNCGFADLQQEIMKRFNIDDVSKIDLKYLDDDHEWVLLTCDADLDECLDIYKSTQTRTIKISLHLASQLKLGKKLVT